MSRRALARFRPGRRGLCEALLFEVTGSDELGERTERIAAATIDEVITYLRRRDPDFRVSSIRYVSLIVLLTGSPFD
jgi:hypothetical protein